MGVYFQSKCNHLLEVNIMNFEIKCIVDSFKYLKNSTLRYPTYYFLYYFLTYIKVPVIFSLIFQLEFYFLQ